MQAYETFNKSAKVVDDLFENQVNEICNNLKNIGFEIIAEVRFSTNTKSSVLVHFINEKGFVSTHTVNSVITKYFTSLASAVAIKHNANFAISFDTFPVPKFNKIEESKGQYNG